MRDSLDRVMRKREGRARVVPMQLSVWIFVAGLGLFAGDGKDSEDEVTYIVVAPDMPRQLPFKQASVSVSGRGFEN